MDFTNGEFAENIARVDHLLAAAARLDDPGTDSVLSKEVLRAAVVFLHSTLEEVIRSLYVHKLPHVSVEHLNTVPLAGRDPSPRPKAIALGDLRIFSGQFVDNVIIESINRYVDMLSLNNSTQLVHCLELAEIPHADKAEFLGPLDALMRRRHQVVHQMDRSNALDPLTEPINDIDASVLRSWRSAVEEFTKSLMASVPGPVGVS